MEAPALTSNTAPSGPPRRAARCCAAPSLAKLSGIANKPLVIFVLIIAALVHGRSARADHPYLAPSSTQDTWFAPSESNEAVFVGGKDAGWPSLVLKKNPLTTQPLILRIRADAAQCRLRSGADELTFASTPGSDLELKISAHPDHPSLFINGREPAELRGAWIRLALKSQDPAITLELIEATYATVRFDAPNRYDSGKPFEKDPSATQPQVRVIKRVPELPPEEPQRDQAPPNAPTWTPHFAAGIEWPSAYYFRGVGQENQDVIFRPWAQARIDLYTDDKSKYFNGLSMDVHVLSSHHFGETGHRPTGGREKFFELDFTGGAAARFLQRWEVGFYYLNRIGVNDTLSDVHEFDLVVKFDDKDPRFDFQLSPYVKIGREYEGNTDARTAGTNVSDQGIYLEVGIRPEFELVRITPYRPLTLHVPAMLGFSIDNYYQDRTGQDDFFGYFSLAAELSYPVFLARAEAGRIFAVRIHGGVEMLVFGNNTQAINEFNGTSDRAVEAVGRVGLSLEY